MVYFKSLGVNSQRGNRPTAFGLFFQAVDTEMRP
jgi:hypothetical protein